MLALLVTASAFAAPPSPEAQARALATDAKKAFDLGQYEQAIAGYEEAYRLKPAPGLLFNLGQSHRRAGHLEQALSYFRRYLETNPASAQAKATEELIAAVQLEAETQRQEAEKAREEQAQRAKHEQELQAKGRELELENARLARAREEKEAADKQLALSLQQQPPPPLKVYQRPAFWIVVGAVAVGAAATITGVALAPQPTVTTFEDINAR